MRRAAVLIAARRADAWIGPCLTALRRSAALLEGWAVDVRIGVDGCTRTARALELLGERYYWAPDHVGCFRMRNALAALGPADAFVEFDADDVMLPEYLPAVLGALEPGGTVQPARYEVTASLTQADPPIVTVPHGQGIRTYSAGALEVVGGHRPWRIGADSEIRDRLARANVPAVTISTPLYLRRRHADSLTNAAATGERSPARQQVRREIAQLQQAAGPVYVRPVGVLLVERRQQVPRQVAHGDPFHVAVILAAYRAAPWIADCLASIRASAAGCPPATRIEVRVGVDACAETTAALEAQGEPYYWAAQNVGAYILRNSLVGIGPADAYVMFDADDVMLPAFLPRMTRALRMKPIIGPSRIECDAHLAPLKPGGPTTHYRHGVCGLRHEAWVALGGFAPERYGADSDLIHRADMRVRRQGRLFVRVERRAIAEALYLRRKHGESLTNHPDTGRRSQVRAEAKRRMARARAAGQWQVETVTVPLEHRGLEPEPSADVVQARVADALASPEQPGDWRATILRAGE